MTTWQEYIVENRPRYVEELKELLRFPSISALPEHAGDVRAAGEWVAERMKKAGIEHVEVMETGGHPVVYGDWLHAPGKTTVLIYGHFDTQPVDPLNLWTNPPFEPTIVGERIYARGASDDKGNSLPTIQAVEALLQTEGALPINVKFFFEGQEEIGSPTLPDFILANKEKFAVDMVLSSDGGQHSETEPALLLGLRGLTALQIDVRGPSRDVHSGGYGGAITNPITALVQLLDSMRSKEGKILIDGFYDGVLDLTDEDRGHLAAIPFDEETFKQDLGLTALYGEPGFSTLERTWARPTLELNGIWGGFEGAGTKTVIPSEAHAKITCRLVADQDPRAIAEAIQAHIEAHTPVGATVSVHVEKSMAWPYLMPADHPGNTAARDVLFEMYGREPYFERSGGSIPVCTLFKNALGVYTINFAFGLEDENIHSPNEYFRLESFYKGHEGYCRLLHRLAQ